MRNNTLDELKQRYEEIPIPEELEGKVRASIAQAKLEDAPKSHRWKPWKTVAVSAAAICLVVVGMANSTAPIVSAMEKVPVLGAITQVVNFRTFEDGNGDNTYAKIDIPKVEQNEALNDQIQTYTDSIIAQYKEDAAITGDLGHYELTLTYKTVTDNDKLFALRFDQAVVMAGAMESVKIYNVDKTSGRILSLKDLFQPDSDYLTVLSDSIKKQMKERMEKDDSLYYWLNDEMVDMNFQKLEPDATFYVNEDGNLVIVFDEGDVAPMYMGVVEFTIPSSVTDPIAESYLQRK